MQLKNTFKFSKKSHIIKLIHLFRQKRDLTHKFLTAYFLISKQQNINIVFLVEANPEILNYGLRSMQRV
jgi:hypothetical protein